MRMRNTADVVTARAAPAAQARASKPARQYRGFVFAIVAALVATAASATILARTWPKMPAPGFARSDAAAPEKQPGPVSISRTNSELCDTYLFDNQSGAMTQVETAPCNNKKKRKELDLDKVNSFSSSWRGR